MERIYLKELNTNFSAYDGKEVTVAGWAKTIRDSKAFGFIATTMDWLAQAINFFGWNGLLKIM